MTCAPALNVRVFTDRCLLYLAATTHDPIILLTVLDELRSRRAHGHS